MNQKENKKTIRKNDGVWADHATQRLEQIRIEKENTRTLMRALPGGRKNCRECHEEEYYPEAKIEQKEVKHE